MRMLARVAVLGLVCFAIAIATNGEDDQDTQLLTDVCEGNTQTYKTKCKCNCDCPTEDDLCPQSCAHHGCPNGDCLKCIACDSAANETECNVVGHPVECCSDQEMCRSEIYTDVNGYTKFKRTCALRTECPTTADARWNNCNADATIWCQKATCNPYGCAAYINTRPNKPHCSDDINLNPKIYVPYLLGQYTQGNCRCDAWCWENGGGGGDCDCCPDFFDMNCAKPSGSFASCTKDTTRGRGRDGEQILDADIF